MLKPCELLENILLDIENGIKNNINTTTLSKKYNISSTHLRRLFSFAFKQPIASYIRSRTLAASLNDILKTNTNILDIAAEYGFEYEQSYIRTFQREFGITPGNLRKTRQIVEITSPLHLFDGNKMDDD
ncbi:MAG: helix-turn-helix transcriptional regulator, partial [Treponema sp.]|nr:helix-turn-helix transcriptional regulator [Treponema sp.]